MQSNVRVFKENGFEARENLLRYSEFKPFSDMPKIIPTVKLRYPMVVCLNLTPRAPKRLSRNSKTPILPTRT